MFSTIRGAAAGVLVLIACTVPLLVPLYLVLGPERVLVGSSLEFNTVWIGLAMVISLIAATLAGWTAHRVSGKLAAVGVLAGVVMIFGLADAAYHHWLMPALSLSREDVSGLALLVALREPLWYDLGGPMLMAVFIWVAGSSRHLEQ